MDNNATFYRMVPNTSSYSHFRVRNNSETIVPLFNNLEPIVISRAVLTPPLPGEKRSRWPKPLWCKTVFVGNLPEKITEDIIRDAFKVCGTITAVRMSKRNFCYLRFDDMESVEQAMLLSGFRIRIDNNDELAFNSRLRVDYASAKNDQEDYECNERARLEEEMDINDTEDQNDNVVDQAALAQDGAAELNILQEKNASLNQQLNMSQQALEDLKITCDDHQEEVITLRIPLGDTKNADNDSPVFDDQKSFNDCATQFSSTRVTNEMQLISLISVFLRVYTFGASIDYICSYLVKIIPNINAMDVKNLLRNYPIVFREVCTGIGATLENKWIYVGFQNLDNGKSWQLFTKAFHDSSTQYVQARVEATEKEILLITVFSIFLYDRPIGASIDCITFYFVKFILNINGMDIENLLRKYPIIFQEVCTAFGAILEKKWLYIGFKGIDIENRSQLFTNPFLGSSTQCI